MASYQQDFGADFNASKISSLIRKWEATDAYRHMVDGNSYYNGINTTIANLTRMYWSDKSKKMTPNPYVSQERIGFGKFHDVVSQKVSTLLNEAPDITDFDDDAFSKKLGFALKKAATYASCCGIGWIFVSSQLNLNVFNPAGCIAFRDDSDSSRILAFIRYWDVHSLNNSEFIRYAEVYTLEGIATYVSGDSGSNFSLAKNTEPYSYAVEKDFLGTRIVENNIGAIPLIELDNNDSKMSDLTPSLRSKIDVIDVINSGFANNIQDFSDVYWVIKNGTSETTDAFEDFMASITKTKKMVVNGDDASSLGAEPHQFEIPTAARSTFCDRMKAEIADETGVVDPKDLTGSSITNVAIKAVTMKLRQRVSDFEWDVYEATLKILKLYTLFTGIETSDDVNFTWLLIDNQTEIVDNAQKIQPNISQKSYLKLLKRADYIENVDDEIAQIQDEANSKFTLEPTPTEADVVPEATISTDSTQPATAEAK